PRSGASRVAYAFLVYVLPPLPRCSDWASSSLFSPSRNSLPRKRRRVGLHIVLFEACSAFTRVAARTLAPSPKCDGYTEGFSHFGLHPSRETRSNWVTGLRPHGFDVGLSGVVRPRTLPGVCSRAPSAGAWRCTRF